jgi:heme o synthase
VSLSSLGEEPRSELYILLRQSVVLRELTMKTTAISLPRLTFPAQSSLTARLGDFVTLMKPRVMLLAVFTALVGLMIAPGHLDSLHASIAIAAIAAGGGAAGVLNMWYEADIDAVMTRTAMRPIPRGKISRAEALGFGAALAGGSVAVLGFALNVVAAALLAFTIFFYVVVYTMWLKRRTPQNIVIGGAAGALPPVIGWAAATGSVGLESLVLFLMIFLWTPPHFWALALNRSDEYARAGIPMLPVVAGRAATTRQILIYSALLVPISLLPCVLGFAGPTYAAAVVICGTILIALTLQLRLSGATDRRVARRVFAFSIVYLFVLFAALLAGGSINRETRVLSERGAWANRGLVQTKLPPHLAWAARPSSLVETDEV